MDRNSKQIEATNALTKLYKDSLNNLYPLHSIIKAVMRFGKSKVILDFLRKNSIDNILIVIPKLANIDTWKEEISKFYPKLHYSICTYRSLHKYTKNYSLIVLDEIHNLTVNMYNLSKDTLHNHILIGLTGTLPRNEKHELLFDILKFSIDFELELKEAIDLNIINNFKLKVIYTDLSNTKNIHVKTKRWDFKTSEILSYRNATKKIAQNPCKRTYLNRSKFLYGIKSKADATKLLLQILPENKKILIFTKRQEIANDLSSNVISSDYDKEHNMGLLDKFIRNKINILASVAMISEGITIPDIDIVIIESFDSNKNNLLQKIGRSLLYVEGKEIIVFIIVAHNTIEEEWLKKIIPEGIEVTHYMFNYGNIKKINYDNKSSNNKYLG